MENMQSAINDRLAEVRIELKQQVAAMEKNLAIYNKLAAGKDYLFPDLDLLLHKDQLDLMAIIEMRLNQEQQQKVANEQPEPEPRAEKKEDQRDLLYTDGEVTEEIITTDIHNIEKWLGKGSLDCYRFDHAGNEYHVELIIRRTGIKTPTSQLQLKEA